MRRFTQLFTDLDQTRATNEKVKLISHYLKSVGQSDAAWAVYFLLGYRPKRTIKTTTMRRLVAEETGLPTWLFNECYQQVGDLAETLSLILDTSGRLCSEGTHRRLERFVREEVLELNQQSSAKAAQRYLANSHKLSFSQCLIYQKLIAGSFRIGVSKKLTINAISKAFGIDAKTITERLVIGFEPTTENYRSLISKESELDRRRKPYPFYLAHPLTKSPTTLGSLANWQIEYKWDGIRAQVMASEDCVSIWSRGEELMTERFPEIADHFSGQEEIILDGEILAWQNGSPLPFGLLQHRINRRQPTQTQLREAPVAFMAYDLLSLDSTDLRTEPLSQRRPLLEQVIAKINQKSLGEIQRGRAPVQQELFTDFRSSDLAHNKILISPLIEVSSWEEIESLVSTSRDLKVEGVMLKGIESVYGAGRERGYWWKWKVAPLTIDAVLMAAQTGHGRRAGLYTDYSFGVWSEGKLVTIAKAYSGLTEAEIIEVDGFIKKSRLRQHGPTAIIEPTQVFELAFDGLQPSSRHKSGWALRFPRILRWRKDKPAFEADNLAGITDLANSL